GLVVEAVPSEATARGETAAIGGYLGAVHVGEPQTAGVATGLVGGKVNNHDLRGMTGEGGAQVAHAGAGVADALHRAVDVEFAPIAGRVRVIQLDEDVTECLIRTSVFFMTRPEGIGVKLNALGAGEPEEHAAEGAVADRQRL